MKEDSRHFNWSAFYKELSRIGPKMLTNVHEDIEFEIEHASTETEDFYSDSLYGTLDAWWESNPTEAIDRTLEVWLGNVQRHIRSVIGPDSCFPWEEMGGSQQWRDKMVRLSYDIELDFNTNLKDLLYRAAFFGETDPLELPSLLLNSIITPYKSTTEGRLIKACTRPWSKIVELLRKDWSVAYQIPPERWEEIIAGAFDEEGYDAVTLTPRSGDFGRDVIAVKHGIGSIRILGSVKAYGPGRLVRQDDVRALAGVLSTDRNASKGIITTTSDFAPRISEDPGIAPLLPYRLELLNGTQLMQWFESLAKEKPSCQDKQN